MVHISLNRSVDLAIIVCASALTSTSAFVGPSSTQAACTLPTPLHDHATKVTNLRHVPRAPQQLFIQSKETTEAEEATSKMSRAIEDNFEADADISITEIQNVYTTTEEAGVFFADSPVNLPGEVDVVSADGSLSGEALLWRGVVVILCALWASNFAVAKFVLSQPGVDTSLFAVTRFAVAALSLLPGSIVAVRKGAISWETAKGAVICGSWVAFGYLGQLIGLIDTTPSRSCVICSLNCIFVAIVAELMRIDKRKEDGYKTSFDAKKLIPALIAVTGVAIIELKGAAGDPTLGDLISFAQPIGFGMGYLQLEELMKKQPSAALPVSNIKLFVVATVAFIYFQLSPHAANIAVADADVIVETAKHTFGGLKVPDISPILASPVALGAIFYTGIITTSLALWVESIAFQRVPATDASIILTTEPLFAAATSAVLVGETFGMSDAVGAAFIIGACVYAISMGESKEICDENTKECIVVD